MVRGQLPSAWTAASISPATFSGTVNFDPSSGVFNLTSHTYQDAYVCKLSSSGSLVWAKDFGGTSAAGGNGIAVGQDGSVYTTGQFDGTVNFNPGSGTYNLSTPSGQEGAYISKLDTNGNFVWATSIVGSSYTQGVAVALGADGSLYATGDFAGSATLGTTVLTSAGLDDVYVAKLTSAGSFLWAESFGGPNYDDAAGMAVGSDGSVYIVGYFQGTSNFNPGGTANLTSNGGYDVFISKLNSSGNYLWAKSFGGSGSDWGEGVALGPDGSVYLTGEFTGTVNFNPGGTFNLTSAGTEDNFVSRLDSSGNFLWAGTDGSSIIDTSGCIDNVSQSLAVAYDGSVYTTGVFDTTSSTADFDPTSGTFYLTGTNSSSNNGFLAKFSAATVNLVSPVLVLTPPAVTSSSTPTLTVSATESGSNMPNGTTVYLNVDLNGDGDFTDPGDSGYASTTLTNGAGTFTITTPLPDGTYRVRARTTDQSGVQGFSAVSTMVVVTSPKVTLSPPVAVEEVALTGTLLAHFSTYGSGNYTATITWGDGTTNSTYTTAYSTTGDIVQHNPADPGQGFDVYGSHTYVSELSGATFSVQVTDGTTVISASTNTFSVADQQLTNLASANLPTTGAKGTALAAITGIATFTDPAGVGNETTADFTATINWGNGATSTGTVVSLGSGNYRVDAPSYTYPHSGTYAEYVTLKHDALPPLNTPTQTITISSTFPVVMSTTPSLNGGTLSSAGATTLAINYNMAMASSGAGSRPREQLSASKSRAPTACWAPPTTSSFR